MSIAKGETSRLRFIKGRILPPRDQVQACLSHCGNAGEVSTSHSHPQRFCTLLAPARRSVDPFQTLPWTLRADRVSSTIQSRVKFVELSIVATLMAYPLLAELVGGPEGSGDPTIVHTYQLHL